jgi:hypothetical protein
LGEVQEMSAITDLIGGIVSGLGDTAIKIRTAITGKDPAMDAKLAQLALEVEAEKAKAESAMATGQLDINKVEAASPNIFIAGWRPFIGWCCGAIFAWNYLFRPVASAIWPTAQLPSIDIATMMPVLLGLLGLAAARTVEKTQGAQGNH